MELNEATAFPDSDFGDTPQDKYMVFLTINGVRGPQQTGCFVLRPAREPEAFEALKVYVAQLPDNSFKKDRLTKWIKKFEMLGERKNSVKRKETKNV